MGKIDAPTATNFGIFLGSFGCFFEKSRFSHNGKNIKYLNGAMQL